ncbi:RAB GTPase H1E isoform 1 [Hibiscus syriacus]|uniref:RAB GTPase H1E isoform 1 n=2 Tax=Hibiscus syriacus TaxID=106335 RepID=A0A6A3ANE9_HIBSY|nr:RAB GTPase H1E isoform 1 [Hibiscus syriacus]
MCLDAPLSCQSCIDLKVDGEDGYSSCILDMNNEENAPETLKSSDESVGNLKSEGAVTHLQKVLQRQASLIAEKSSTERVHDAPTNRWRRYKRAASFDSRKIVLLFSILSSVGSLILIYLTLRVRQSIDGFNHV